MTSHPLSVTRSAGTAKRTFQGKGIWLQSSIAEIAVNAIYSASLHEQTQNKVRQLDSLRTIDQTINSSLDLRVMLRVIVGEAPKLIPMDALAILIYYQRTLKLMYASGSGLKNRLFEIVVDWQGKLRWNGD
jgi:hypothetical protein